MIDVFSKLDDARVETYPFPFLVIEDFLPDQVCDALIKEMPPLRVLTHGQSPGDNMRFNFSYSDAVIAPDVPPIWRDVLAQAVSQSFLDRFFRLFGPSILEFYPDFERRFGPIKKLRAELRRKRPHERGSSEEEERSSNGIMLDAQIAVNTPALTGGTSVRPPHLDRTDKLFIGLLYLRSPEDDSTGADLELLTPKDNGTLVYGHQRMLPSDRASHVRTIRYKRNTLVLFLNTPKSLHGVTPRQATPHTRYFINLIGETSEQLFEVETLPAQRKIVASKRRWWGLLNGIWGNRGERAQVGS